MTDSPYRAFKKRLCTFAGGQAGIRNPFVIAAVDPSVEHRVAERLSTWATGADEIPPIDDGVTVQPIWLDELLPRTEVYNLSVALGYINASWTLKCELIARYTRRLFDHMEAEGWDWAMPEAPPPDAARRTTFELSSGYLERARDVIPQQTDRAHWRMLQNYVADRQLIAGGPVTDHMRFGRRPA